MLAAEWWSDQAFWQDVEPYLFSPDVYARADADVEELLEDLEPEPESSILDVGCGTGRLMLPLAQRGFRVVGVDLCDRYRQNARQRGVNAGIELDVRAGSAFDLGLSINEQFDIVLDSFAVIGYAAHPVQDILAVQGMKAALKPGGRIVIQTRNPQNSTGQLTHRGRSGLCVEQRSYDSETRTMTTRWMVSVAGFHRTHRTELRVYTADDLRGLMEFCEFSDIRIINTPQMERITVYATNPNE